MSVWEDLRLVQAEVHAPRNEESRFGMARSAEGILAAAKPVCHEHGLALTCTDEVVQVGPSNYVKATAAVFNGEGDSVFTVAWACEGPVDKGLDASQVTGKASSYARKYALQGLFALDDRKDADTDRPEASGDAIRAVGHIPASPAQVAKVQAMIKAKHPELTREARLDGLTKMLGREISSAKDMTQSEASNVIRALS